MEPHLYPSYLGEVPNRGLSMVSLGLIGDGICSVARAAILRVSTAALTDKTNAGIEAG